jgi:hypothetical protein
MPTPHHPTCLKQTEIMDIERMIRTAQGDATTVATPSLPLGLHGTLLHSTCCPMGISNVYPKAAYTPLQLCTFREFKVTAGRAQTAFTKSALNSISIKRPCQERILPLHILKFCKLMQLPQTTLVTFEHLGICCISHTRHCWQSQVLY